ncbi:MAG: hypothetical protein DRP84_01465 [Spirochaetes bacterium]|nr:MAG: hypothetical protein DRP84_01465 [Spirochaetota bacterium]
MKKRIFIYLSICVVLASSLFLTGLKENVGSKYKYPENNIILISIDTLRADHLGCYGYHRNTSPNIDRLTEESIVFDNTFSHIASTVPSHMTMITSLYPSIHEAYQLSAKVMEYFELSKSIVTLPQILKKKKYTTGAFVSLPDGHGFGRGVDMFKDCDLVQWCTVGEEKKEPFFSDNELFEWIEENKDKKFFLFFHTYSVHDPYISPDYELFSADYDGDIPDTYDDWKKLDLAEISWQDKLRKSNPPSDEYLRDIQHLIDLYDGCIAYTDRQLGFLFKRLEKLDLFKKSIVILTADHGEEFNEHGGLGHGALWREHLHVPLIIKLPNNIKKRIRSDVGLIDIVPTVLDLAGINFKPKKYSFQGESLLGAIKGRPNIRDIYAEFAGRTGPNYKKDLAYFFSLKTKKWKYLECEDGGSNLFNIISDPEEKDNVIFDYPTVSQTIIQKLRNINQNNKKLRSRLKVNKTTFTIHDEALKRLRALGYVN